MSETDNNVVKFPYSASRRVHSRQPRKSKNGTPEERASSKAPAAREPIFALIEQHRIAQAECTVAADDDDNAATEAKWVIENALARIQPTTLAGILAIMQYERELSDRPLEFSYDLFDFESRHAEPPRLTIRTWLTTIEQSIAAIAENSLRP
jgi:hypothetical protein